MENNYLDLLAQYVDYRCADGCLDWDDFKSVKERQEIIDDFKNYIEKKKQNTVKEFDKYVLKKQFDKVIKKMESIESALDCIQEDIEYSRSLVKEARSIIKELKEDDGNE